jgi:hypothetical protein
MTTDPQHLIGYAAHDVNTSIRRFLELSKLHPAVARAEAEDLQFSADKLIEFLIKAQEKKAA